MSDEDEDEYEYEEAPSPDDADDPGFGDGPWLPPIRPKPPTSPHHTRPTTSTSPAYAPTSGSAPHLPPPAAGAPSSPSASRRGAISLVWVYGVAILCVACLVLMAIWS